MVIMLSLYFKSMHFVKHYHIGSKPLCGKHQQLIKLFSTPLIRHSGHYIPTLLGVSYLSIFLVALLTPVLPKYRDNVHELLYEYIKPVSVFKHFELHYKWCNINAYSALISICVYTRPICVTLSHVELHTTMSCQYF